MPPLLPSLVSLLALSATVVVDASPLAPPGRHAPPYLASKIGMHAKRALSFLEKKYYGETHGLVGRQRSERLGHPR